MEFKPFIYNARQEQIPVSIVPMTDADAQKTTSAWQTSWVSDYLRLPKNYGALLCRGAARHSFLTASRAAGAARYR